KSNIIKLVIADEVDLREKERFTELPDQAASWKGWPSKSRLDDAARGECGIFNNSAVAGLKAHRDGTGNTFRYGDNCRRSFQFGPENLILGAGERLIGFRRNDRGEREEGENQSEHSVACAEIRGERMQGFISSRHSAH